MSMYFRGKKCEFITSVVYTDVIGHIIQCELVKFVSLYYLLNILFVLWLDIVIHNLKALHNHHTHG